MAEDDSFDKLTGEVLRQLGIRRAPSVDEMNLMRKWTGEWAFSQDDILAACAETTKSRTPTMAYLDSILDSLRRGEGERFEGLKDVLRELGSGDAKPSPEQLRSYERFLSAGFEPETVRLAAVQCNRKKKRSFPELEIMLGKWQEMSLFRADAAEAYIREMTQLYGEVRALLEKSGSERRPGMADLATYEEWKKLYAPELMDYAAECARGRTMPMQYMAALLDAWQKNGVTDVEAARAEHASHAAAGVAAAAPVNPALNYTQRTYTEDDYADVFVDLTKENL